MTSDDRSEFLQQLSKQIRGGVRTDRMSRLLYSTDASLYQIQPLAVAFPADEEDVIAAVNLAARHRVPILGRGAGTSLAGQTVSPGLVLDFSRHMNQVLEVNPEERWVRVQPGIVLDNLNAHLAPHGLFFAPDVATSSRANVGGMIGNNSSGTRSVRYGKTVDHVLALRAVLASGEPFWFEQFDEAQVDRKSSGDGTEAAIYRSIRKIVEKHREQIESQYPKVMRRVSGYNLDELVDPGRFNLAKLLCGSEGTLGVFTEARLNLEPVPRSRMVAVLHFQDMLEAIRTVPAILEYRPSAVELLDHYGMELARSNPNVSALCREFISGDPQAILLVEFSDGADDVVRGWFTQMAADPRVKERVFHIHQALLATQQQHVWQVRKNALGVMLGIRGDYKPLAFIEDSCVPVEHLAEYVAAIQEVCRRHERSLALYAHASVGVIHLRPLLNLRQQEDVEKLRAISGEAFDLVKKFGGSWSGEHGDGLVRSYKLQEFFGDELYQAFREVKSVFDPDGILNPGKIVDAPDPTENFRIHPGYHTSFPATYYRFEQEGGFDKAVELCTGVGQCRKTIAGTMCPSFIATRDEEHSTRGRANALRVAMAGQLGPDGFQSPRLFEVLDLCLECKACKSECPSNVDMAKMKAEFLSHYYESHGFPLDKKLVGATRRTAELASKMPGLANWATGNPVTGLLLERFAGFDRRRKPPRYAGKTFGKWFRERAAHVSPGRPTVTIFGDTFTNFYEPEVGISAFQVLEALGYDVQVADVGCCGRPLISSGMLRRARDEGGVLIERLARIETPILVLEPSCYSTLKDDYPDLMVDCELTRNVLERVFSLEEFLGLPDNAERLSSLFTKAPSQVLFHGHCQQKALIGGGPTLRMLGKLPGTAVEEVPEGCCGMAGVFGYEKRHYELSEKIGSRHLLPAIRNAEPGTMVVVSGTSCRSQVRHFTDADPVHPAVALARSL